MTPGINVTGKDRIPVEIDDEQIDVYNHVSVSTHHYVNSINGYETFDGTVAAGDDSHNAPPEAVTDRLAHLLDDEFDINVREQGITVVDLESDEVTLL